MLAINSDQFRIYVVTCSYSSCMPILICSYPVSCTAILLSIVKFLHDMILIPLPHHLWTVISSTMLLSSQYFWTLYVIQAVRVNPICQGSPLTIGNVSCCAREKDSWNQLGTLACRLGFLADFSCLSGQLAVINKLAFAPLSSNCQNDISHSPTVLSSVYKLRKKV